jgi:[ribosomal protein S5]-alanine N-acetyltransferase
VNLETERLRLRSATPADAPHLQSLFSFPEVLRFVPPRPPMTLKEAEERVGRRIRMEKELGFAPLIIEMKETGQFIGSGGLQPVGMKDGADIEIAYHFVPTAWGHGYATEAAATILGFGFGTAGLDKILGFVFPENVASWRVLEKIGMRYAGMGRYPGIDVPIKTYDAERRTWKNMTLTEGAH